MGIREGKKEQGRQNTPLVFSWAPGNMFTCYGNSTAKCHGMNDPSAVVIN